MKQLIIICILFLLIGCNQIQKLNIVNVSIAEADACVYGCVMATNKSPVFCADKYCTKHYLNMSLEEYLEKVR